MKRYLITASTDGVYIDFETTITMASDPEWWQIYELCNDHGCPFYTVNQVDENGELIRQIEW